MKKLLLYLLFVTIAISCAKKKIPGTVDLGLDYYPKQIGKFVEYDVDSTVYNDLTMTSKQYKYRIKEKFTADFTDNEGKPAIRLERYIKMFNANIPYSSMPYVIKEVWMVNADEKKIQVVESNVRFTKLIFPVQQNASWNGNAGNTMGEWDYTYSYIDRKESINANTFNEVLMVKQKDDKNLIAWKYYAEKYAKGVGLVYREIKDIYSNNVLPNVPIEQRIEKGLVYKQTIVNFGYE